MFDMGDFLKVVKKTAVDAVNASKPTDVVFGTVVSISPLKIKIDQKLILTSTQLVLSRNVTNHKVTFELDPPTETQTVTVKNALKTGEMVILIRKYGGQKYVVVDRIGKG